MEVDDLSSGSFKSIRIHMNSDRLFNLILVYTCFIILKESGFLISVLYFLPCQKNFFGHIFSKTAISVKARKLRSFFIFFCCTFYLVLHVFFSMKTIFMYLYRCAKSKSEFVISRSKVLNDLKMGTDMYKNHLNKLKQSGYISSEPCRNEKGRICGIKFYINYPNSLKRLENNGFRKLEHE